MSATLTNLVIQICLGAILFLIPWFLQTMLFANAFDTGLAMMPLTLLMLALTFITARLIARISIKYLTIIGIAIMIGGIIFTASLFDPAMTIMSLAPGLAVIGVGMPKWGELWDKDVFDLITDPVYEALTDAGVEKNQIEADYYQQRTE